MPASTPFPLPSAPQDPRRQALMASFYEEHRPELADLIGSAELVWESRGLWVRPAASFGSVSTAWLEPHLLTAACEAGLDLDWIHVLASLRGGEA